MPVAQQNVDAEVWHSCQTSLPASPKSGSTIKFSGQADAVISVEGMRRPHFSLCGLSGMRSDLRWHRTELAARQANGRGDVNLAIKLFAQSVDEARDPKFHWSELQSALSGSASFHEYVTHNYELALAQLRESQAILNQYIGADTYEARNFAESIAECEAKAKAT